MTSFFNYIFFENRSVKFIELSRGLEMNFGLSPDSGVPEVTGKTMPIGVIYLYVINTDLYRFTRSNPQVSNNIL